MTIFFPDVSPFQGSLSLSGAPAVALKVTEGTGWPSSSAWFQSALGRARAAGAFQVAYHFLHQGNPAGQAAFCHSRAGAVPLMLDWEPAGSSRPGVADAAGFIDAYRHGGGVCNLMYLPHWYWQQIGSPSLKPFADRHMSLWSSAYTTYTDAPAGAGWRPYGGMPPAVWQYTDKHSFNGALIDFSAYRGTLAQLEAIAAGRPPGPPPDGKEPVIRQGDTGPAVGKCQSKLNLHGAAPALTVDHNFGAKTGTEVRDFQSAQHLTADGVVGPATWGELDKPAHPLPPRADPAAAAGKPYHGQWVAAGMASLHDLCNATLGYPVNSVLRMTAVKYGAFDEVLAGYIADVFAGKIPPTAHLPKGASLWCN